MNVEVTTKDDALFTVEDVLGFRIDEDLNLIIWRGPAEGQDPKGWTDVAFFKNGYWLAAIRVETA